MLDLEYGLLQLMRQHREGSHATQRGRRKILSLAARQLYRTCNFQLPNVRSLKPKHVAALVTHWKNTVSTATLKNRIAALRWWANKVGKRNIVPTTNAQLGVGSAAAATMGPGRTSGRRSDEFGKAPGS